MVELWNKWQEVFSYESLRLTFISRLFNLVLHRRLNYHTLQTTLLIFSVFLTAQAYVPRRICRGKWSAVVVVAIFQIFSSALCFLNFRDNSGELWKTLSWRGLRSYSNFHILFSAGGVFMNVSFSAMTQKSTFRVRATWHAYCPCCLHQSEGLGLVILIGTSWACACKLPLTLVSPTWAEENSGTGKTSSKNNYPRRSGWL